MELSLKKLLNQPICVKFEFEWQKGYALSFFKDCDNFFRLDDANFMYLHFRNYNNCTFYSDEKGVSDNKRPIYPFADFFKLIV
jgi:hypothetical protein